MRRYMPWLLGAAALAAPWLAGSTYQKTLLNLVVINAVLVVGYYVIFSLTGILSIAHHAFWGLGAYTAAILSVDYGAPVWLGFLAAPAVAALAGVLLGVPTLKLKTHYLTLATIGFAEMVRQLMINWEKLTHGPQGITGIPAVVESHTGYYYFALAVLGLTVLAVLRLQHSRLGRGMQAVRDDELAASLSGVSAVGLKVLAFAFSAAIAGLAGALFAHQVKYVSPDTFHLETTVVILAMLMIGGRSSLPGVIAGAVLLTYLPEWLRFMKTWYLTVYGLGMLLILIYMPEGLAGAARRALGGLRR